MHLYPGQLVYIPDEKKLGIYLAYELGKQRWDDPSVYVWRFTSKDGSTSDTFIYDFKELVPITVPDKKSITGQRLYVTGFQREDLTAFIGDKTLEELEPSILAECQNVMKTKWFKDKYEIDLTDPKALKAIEVESDGKGTN
jgi:hypothetical protein